MAELDVKQVTRKFMHGKIELPDIPGLTPKEIGKAYSGQYPELTNVTFTFKEITSEGVEIWETKAQAGIKG